MKPNRLKQLLADNMPVTGSWTLLASPTAADIMAMIGFDYLVIDMEHGTGDYQMLLHQVYAINAVGKTTPIVRVQSNDAAVIKRVMDAGAEGVMVPGIRTAEDARKAIAATRFPPHGNRSVSFPRASAYGLDPDYLGQTENNFVVLIQIETSDAVANIEEILDVPGIDIAFIGPNDLAAELGHLGDMQHPDVLAATAKVVEAAQARNIAVGTITGSLAAATAYLDRGYRAITLMSDMALLISGAKDNLEGLLNHPVYRTANHSTDTNHRKADQ